jgi:hypothetical protein
MKVKIGPYIHHWSVSHLEQRWIMNKYGDFVDDRNYDKVDYLVLGFLDFWQVILNLTINKFQGWRDRKISVRIDRWDTWNMDNTLALIIVPMLKQLKEEKNGGPWVDAEDVSEELRTNGYDEDGEVDENWFNRWDYVLNEMIFAFENIAADDWREPYYDMPYETGIKPIEDRIRNGTRLFGKYYQNLWD